MLLAAAQFKPTDNDYAANLQQHLRMSEKAADAGAQVILFPEMSLTGYVMETAAAQAIAPGDAKLQPLQQLAVRRGITIIAGAPVQNGNQLHIGSFIFQADGQNTFYTKQFLHGRESDFFTVSNAHNPLLLIGNQRIANAICADITHAEHPKAAQQLHPTIYAASIFYTPGGIAEAYEQLGYYARTYRMHVLMANYCGSSYTYEAAGRSACWNANGEVIAALDATSEGLLLAELKR